MPEFVLRISTPADLSGSTATIQALGQVEQGAAKAAAAGERLAQAAEKMPNASLESLAASAQHVAGNFGNVAVQLDAIQRTQMMVARSAAQIAENTAGIRKPMAEAKEEAKGFSEYLKQGFGIDFAGRAIHGLEEIGHLFTESIHRGVEYNAEMQTLGLGLAATFRSVQPEKFLSFEAAKQAGSETMDVLRTKANDLGVDMRGLVESYSANLHALIEGGVTEPAKQIELVSTLIQAERAKGVTGANALRDSIDILNGRASNIVVARELGLTEAELKKAAESGQTYSYIMQHLGGYQEAAAEQADSYTNSLTRLHNQFEALEGLVAKPAFDRILALLQGGKGDLGGPTARGIAKGLGDTVDDTLGLLSRGPGTDTFEKNHPQLNKLLAFADSAVKYLPGGVFVDKLVGNVQGDILDEHRIDDNKQVEGITKKVSEAKDDKAVAEARKELEEAIAAATERAANAQGVLASDARAHLADLRQIQATFGENVGKAPVDTAAADARAAKDAGAKAAYLASPVGQASQSEEDALAAERHVKAVESLAKEIEKQFPMSQKQAHDLAEERVKRDENTKAAAALNKELDETITKTDRLLSSGDVAGKLRDVYGGIIGKLPEGSRGGLGTAPTNENLFAVEDAVNGVKVPEGDKAALDAKKALVDALREAVALQHDYNEAVGREGRDQERTDKDAKEAAANIKQTADTIADEKEQTAILEARGRGEKDVADALEKQRDIRQEIERLQKAGVGYAEALALATAKVNAQNSAQDEKEAERAARHHSRVPREHHRRGERETFTIDGYSTGGDAVGSGLHTGSLTTGNLGGSGGSTAADALATAPTYVPTFPRGGGPLFPPGSDPMASLFAGGLLAPLFGAPSAASSIGATGVLGPLGSGAFGSTAPGAGVNAAPVGGNDPVATAAQRAADSASRTADSASGAVTALDSLGRALGNIQRALEEVKKKAETLEAQSQHTS